ncbi:MAG: SHOCT domain-containing protein [Syntrophobacteria bacterium]
MNKVLVEITHNLESLIFPLTQRGEPPSWGPGMMGNWGYGMMGWFGPIMMLVFWGLIILVLILVVRWLWTSSDKKPEQNIQESPLDILKRRYASGEIDREEFELKKKDLTTP